MPKIEKFSEKQSEILTYFIEKYGIDEHRSFRGNTKNLLINYPWSKESLDGFLKAKETGNLAFADFQKMLEKTYHYVSDVAAQTTVKETKKEKIKVPVSVGEEPSANKESNLERDFLREAIIKESRIAPSSSEQQYVKSIESYEPGEYSSVEPTKTPVVANEKKVTVERKAHTKISIDHAIKKSVKINSSGSLYQGVTPNKPLQTSPAVRQQAKGTGFYKKFNPVSENLLNKDERYAGISSFFEAKIKEANNKANQLNQAESKTSSRSHDVFRTK